ncbi:MAG: ABC transporter ATP-binding protein [Phycisphaerales bacterium]|nr:ABC transporter ATP-binding protein [Phycisphaerales bacterium]MCB9862690.1 ABC transporter ATP-binding protein [Phycisphaerales bacterium]
MIQLDKLMKHYPMGDTMVRALDGVDLSIKSGEFVSITGHSGSGKSTLMHLLGCLDRPTSGRYMLDGQLVSHLSDRSLAQVRNRKIGFVFQTFNLIQRTSAIDNVAVPLFYGRQSNVGEKSRKALERVGLGPRATHKPSELSGGERQRVAIARAIVNEPKIILADEPTGNLDTRTGKQIMDIFHELHRAGVTVILVTHEMDVAVQAERVIRMRDGNIIDDRRVDDSTRSELLSGVMLPAVEQDPGPDRSPPPIAKPVGM